MTFAAYYTDALLAELEIEPSDPDYAAKQTAATSALGAALQFVETYLDRWLEYRDDQVETFGPPPAATLLLRRYPVESITSVAWPPWAGYAGGTVPLAGYMADLPRGIVYGGWGFGGWQTVVTYAGGYPDDAWPVDLLAVVMDLAAALFPGIYETGHPVSGTLTPAIKRTTTPDVGTTEYFDSGAGGSVAVLGYGAIPASAIGVLDRYRAESAVGGA